MAPFHPNELLVRSLCLPEPGLRWRSAGHWRCPGANGHHALFLCPHPPDLPFVMSRFISNTPLTMGFGYPVGWMTCCLLEVAYFYLFWKHRPR